MYASVQELIDRFGASELLQLAYTADDAGDEVLDTARIEQAITAATALMTGYLPSDIDMDAEAHNLARVCGDLARYELYDNRTTDAVDGRKQDAMHWLKDVQSGKTRVARIARTDDDALATSGEVQFGSTQRVF